jgi:HEAT repeat protein
VNLLLAISSLDPHISVPLLSRALDLPEADARIGAARFLEYTQSDSALDALLGALHDPDSQVQFAVMQSLGNLTGDHEWRPTSDAESDPFWGACLRHWAEFANQRRVLSARH